MLRGARASHRALMRAVEVAIARGDLPPAARRYGKIDLLELLAEAMGLHRNALRNLYYRDEARLEIVLQGYLARQPDEVSRGLRELQFHRFSPLVWKRPQAELEASRRALPATVVLLQAAEKPLREAPDPPIELRREIGAAAAEVMACALTFFEGRQRWDLLREGERIFRSAMSTLLLDPEVSPEDAALFARFWENRASICGLLWSEIWDDPAAPPTASPEVVALALDELDRAAEWARRHPGAGAATDEGERLRQLLADKAKWLAKAGRFPEAWTILAALGRNESRAAVSDRLLIATLEHIANADLRRAARRAGELAELWSENADEGALAPVTSTMLVHHVELLRGRRPALPVEVQAFLTGNPVVASEMLNLPRYRGRLAGLGYGLATPVN